MPASIDPLIECTVATQDLAAYPGGKAFLAAYKAKYGTADPDPYAIYGYEAMKLGLDTIGKLGAQGNDKAAVLKALFATKARGLGARHLRVRQERRHDAEVLRPVQGRTHRRAGVLQDDHADEDRSLRAGPWGGRAVAPSPYTRLRHSLEASSLTPRLPAPAMRPLAAVRRFSGRWGWSCSWPLLPIYYGIRDLTHGYQAGLLHGHPVIHHDLSHLGFNLVQGLSNGAIWALIAIGYTLVYGIIELINFAHGDVFMIGSFTSAGFWGTLGLGLATGPIGLIAGLVLTLVVSMAVCGSLNVLIERVAYRPLRSAPKLASLITAVGFSFILQNVGLLWLGGSPRGSPTSSTRARPCSASPACRSSAATSWPSWS